MLMLPTNPKMTPIHDEGRNVISLSELQKRNGKKEKELFSAEELDQIPDPDSVSS